MSRNTGTDRSDSHQPSDSYPSYSSPGYGHSTHPGDRAVDDTPGIERRSNYRQGNGSIIEGSRTNDYRNDDNRGNSNRGRGRGRGRGFGSNYPSTYSTYQSSDFARGRYGNNRPQAYGRQQYSTQVDPNRPDLAARSMPNEQERVSKQQRKMDAKLQVEKANFLSAEKLVTILKSVQLDHDKCPIFVCIDTEFWEYDKDRLLELGMAILDCHEIAGVDPGDRAETFICKLQYHHFLVKENIKKVNGKFCPGHPDKFLHGKTAEIPLMEIAPAIEKILNPMTAKDPRTVILVGHAYGNDDKILQTLNFAKWPPRGFYGTVDTQKIANQLLPERFPSQPSLGKVLEGLGIKSAYLHNGGNDAAFTLQAMLVLAHLTEEQKTFLQPKIPNLPGMKRTWEGDIEPQEPEPKRGKRGMVVTPTMPAANDKAMRAALEESAALPRILGRVVDASYLPPSLRTAEKPAPAEEEGAKGEKKGDDA